MIKDYWIWQARKVDTPRAIYVIKEYTKPYRAELVGLDVTIYSEDIKNMDHFVSFLDWHFENIDGYVQAFREQIEQFAEFNDEDAKQIADEIFKILLEN